MRRMLVLLASLATLAAWPHSTTAAPARQAVYVNLADSLQGTFDGMTSALRSAFTANGWEVLVVHEVAAGPAPCAYRARVFVVNSADYARQVMAHGPRAAFALPVRLALFEDEAGTHLAMVNPLSINRTIVAETGFEAPSEALVSDVSKLAGAALQGRFLSRPFGQVRDRGLIGRTMGIMAGGPFLEKIKDVHVTAGDTPQDVARVADEVWKGLEQGAGVGRWQIRGVYRLDLSAQGVVVIGVSGAAMESKSFAIVGAGSEAGRSRLRCPGTAHAAAYPIEIVVFRDQGKVHVGVADGMYRMKMYFEDSGKMKFAANMGMPGSIEDEIRTLVLAGVGGQR